MESSNYVGGTITFLALFEQIYKALADRNKLHYTKMNKMKGKGHSGDY